MANCIISYKGTEYSYTEFMTALHNGLFDSFVKDGVINEQGFKDKGEKEKRVYKKFEEKTHDEKVRALTLSFDQFSQTHLKRDLMAESESLDRVNERLDDPDLTDEQREFLEKLKSAIEQRKKQDLRDWFTYREDMKWVATMDDDIRALENKVQNKEISEEEYVKGMTELYNVVMGFGEVARATVESNIMSKMAYVIFRNQKEHLAKNEKYVEEMSNKTDISTKDVYLKNLGHMTEKVPELQTFGKMFDDASFDKIEEAKERKNTFEKLGTAVIRDINKKLGIKEKAGSVFSSDSAKYFDWMDKNGEMITLNEASGLSESQINFLKYYREMIAEYRGIIEGDIYNMEMQVLKTDPSFTEAFKQDGITQAWSNFLGTNYNLKQVRIKFKNPETGIEDNMAFGDIEKKLIDYGKKGLMEKGKALALILKYNRSARLQLKKGVNIDENQNPLLVKNNSQYSIDSKGVLSSKFDKPRDKDRGYSKDFYRAGIEFIDDMTHIKHMSKLVPVINSIEHLNKEGYEDHMVKPNVVKWVQDWRDLHIFKNPKQTLPEIDVALRFLRFFTSATTMMFNVPAGVMNLAMGLYNNWRAETGAWRGKGHRRIFLEGNRKVNKDYAFGAINPYAVDILKKYQVVSTDYDSNPKLFAGRIFDNLAHVLTRYGEFQIQGSMFLGQLTDTEWNAFEYKKNKYGIDELVLKDSSKEQEIKRKFIEYKNKVSDIQGKYGEKDRRNFTNNELGKSAAQFKTWMPDWWKMRFGERYIDANGNTVQGSWRTFTGEGLQQLKQEIREKGTVKAFWENKDFMANLKGAMVTVFFMSLAYQDDDDRKRRNGAIDADNALSQLLFVFDPNQLKFTISRPIAAVGTIEKFIDAADHLIKLDTEKLGKDVIKLTPANKLLKAKELFE